MLNWTLPKRCIRCRKKLRADGTCQNPKCVRYTPETGAEGKPKLDTGKRK